MLHIPILRSGTPYRSVDVTTLVHHATREPVAELSLANSGIITRDVGRMDDGVLERLPIRDLIAMCRRAAGLFMSAELPLDANDGPRQSFDQYVNCLSATTGMPVAYCRRNAEKIHRVLDEIEQVLAGLTRGFPLEIIDRGYGSHDGRMLSFFRAGRRFGAVLPSNSPGVHSLWIPAVPLKTPLVLKPGREEPWTPLRVISALVAAGVPRTAFGFYPTDHGGAAALLGAVDRAMLFGDASTTKPWLGDRRIELHGPGYSKIVLGPDLADEWERHLDVMVESIAANAGRSCINCSGVWTPRHGRAIAEALAERLAKITALPVDHPQAQVAAFARPEAAEGISAMIDAGLRGGAVDLTAQKRGSPRLVKQGGVAYLLPTIIWIEPPAANPVGVGAWSGPDDEQASWRHPLANKEFLLPFAAVVECPSERIPDAIGPSLIVSAFTRDRAYAARLMAAGHVDRLNIGVIPTNRISWDQPHEGNLFEHLYRQRAFQTDAA